MYQAVKLRLCVARRGVLEATAMKTDHDIDTLLHASRRLMDAPEAVIQSAINVFRAGPRQEPPAASLLQRLQALLSFDSRQELALGVRSLGESPVRQLVFTAPGCDVDLRIERLPGDPPGRVRLTGQLLGPKPEVEALLLIDGAQWQARCDDLSEFRFDDVPAGATALQLRGDSWELALPTFNTQWN
jgi:hypothetical protein